MDRLQSIFNQKHDHKKIVADGRPWTDPDFPHDNSVTKGIEGTFRWYRASQIFKNREKVYDSFSGNDIIQGVLGDCYLLSSISALAEFPGRVQKLFIQKEKNAAGCYVVTLYVSGKRVDVVLDDYFPVDTSNQPAFAGSQDQELWVMLIEKAWAKVHGDFAIIEGGDSRESLAAITGAPVEYKKHSTMSTEELWKLLKTSDMNNYAMCTGANVEVKGIVKSHAYTLIGAYEFVLNGEKVRLIQIRNPWGCSEWTGEWSDNDPRWTTNLRREFSHVSKDDGIFFMPFDEFSKIFIHTFVAMTYDDYVYSDLPLTGTVLFSAFQLAKQTKGFVSAYQVTPRLGPILTPGYKIVALDLELYQVDARGTKKLKLAYNNALGQANIPVDLEPGYYVMKAKMDSACKLPSVVFSAYTDIKVTLVELKVKDVGEATLDKVKDALGVIKAVYVATPSTVPASEETAKTRSRKYAGAFRNCLAGHRLKFDTSPSASGDQFKCENCRASKSVGDGRWACKDCKYDICTKCRPQNHGNVEQSTTNKDASVVKCGRGHTMTFEPSSDKNTVYLCEKCGKAYLGMCSCWKCATCQSNLCRLCMAPPKGFKSVGEILEIDTCPKGDRLNFIVAETMTGMYDCYICSKLGSTHNGRWACLDCGVNICHVCKPCSKAKDGTLSVKTGSLVCDKGHVLLFGSAPPPSGHFIGCNKCERRINDHWRWTCRECDFDVCANCRPEPPGKREHVCTNMHKLTYSNLAQGETTYGRCNRCHQTFLLSEGRYCCFPCAYECCNKCVPQLGTFTSVLNEWLFEKDGSGTGGVSSVTDRFNCDCIIL